MAYTAEQKSTIEYLINRGKAVHKALEEADDGNRERLSDELNYIKLELHDVMNAEAKFRAHLRIAKEHLAEAESLLKKYGRR